MDVCYIINRHPFDTAPAEDSQLLYHLLWSNGIFLNIADEQKIHETLPIVCQWMDELLLPEMEKLCAAE